MRVSEQKRKTKETDIAAKLALDGSGKSEITTGIGFFDHMLTAFAKHSGFDIELSAKGDIEVDQHHTVEDVGIVLGTAIREALGNKRGIARFADCFVPMDESLAFAALDISGRGHLELEAQFQYKLSGGFETDAAAEFFEALAANAGVTLHLRVMYGANDHHKLEALFKAAARAFSAAVRVTGTDVPSTKGNL